MEQLEMQHKHVMKLIERDRNTDGWATVSDQLAPHLQANMPPELVTFEKVDGVVRARLTEEGQNVLDAMKWL